MVKVDSSNKYNCYVDPVKSMIRPNKDWPTNVDIVSHFMIEFDPKSAWPDNDYS